MSKAKMQEFDARKAVAVLKKKGIHVTELSRKMGRSSNYLTNSFKKGEMPQNTFLMFCDFAGVSPDDLLVPSFSPSKICPIYQTHGITLDVRKDKLRMALTFGDQELYSAWSKIKGDTELDLMQAISYAAHLMYKIAEQNQLQE